MNVAVLGMGAMGSRMADALLEAGHSVIVWNRTAARCAPLSERGASVAASAAEAAKGCGVVLAMVRDDEASRSLWLGDGGVLESLADDTVAIDASTLSPAWAVELAEHFEARGGVSFLESPVLGSRPQIEAHVLATLVSGDKAAIEVARPVFEAYSAKVVPLGGYGRAAAMKLAVNSLLAVQVAAYSESLLGLIAQGFERDAAADVLSGLPITSPAMQKVLGAIQEAAHSPNFPIELVAKDLGYAETATGDAPHELVAVTRTLFDRAVDAEAGDVDITGLITTLS